MAQESEAVADEDAREEAREALPLRAGRVAAVVQLQNHTVEVGLRCEDGELLVREESRG